MFYCLIGICRVDNSSNVYLPSIHSAEKEKGYIQPLTVFIDIYKELSLNVELMYIG